MSLDQVVYENCCCFLNLGEQIGMCGNKLKMLEMFGKSLGTCMKSVINVGKLMVNCGIVWERAGKMLEMFRKMLGFRFIDLEHVGNQLEKHININESAGKQHGCVGQFVEHVGNILVTFWKHFRTIWMWLENNVFVEQQQTQFVWENCWNMFGNCLDFVVAKMYI